MIPLSRIAIRAALGFLALAAVSRSTALTPMKQTVAPIQQPARVVTYHVPLKQHMDWCERTMVKPFEARAKGQPWTGAALPFVRRSLPYLMPLPEPGAPRELIEEGERLVKGGCNDPLVVYLA